MEGLSILFAGAVVAPLLSAAIYAYSRRRWDVREQNTTSRAYLFYRMLSAVLLGQFLGHTYNGAGAADTRYLYAFIAVGYVFIMDVWDNVGRVWNTNVNYVGYASDDDHDVGLNRDTMQPEPYVVGTDVSSPSYADGILVVMNTDKLLRRRRWLLAALFVVLIIVSLMDGFLVVVRGTTNQVALVVCYYASTAAMTVALCGAMIHARLQAVPRAWLLLSAAWCAVLVCCALPAMLFANRAADIATALNSRAFLLFYGLASGCMLWLHRYFYNMKRGAPSKQQTAQGIVVFAVGVAQGVLSGYFL